MTKVGPKKFLKINDYEKPTKKEERNKKATFQKPFLLNSKFQEFETVQNPQNFKNDQSWTRKIP